MGHFFGTEEIFNNHFYALEEIEKILFVKVHMKGPKALLFVHQSTKTCCFSVLRFLHTV